MLHPGETGNPGFDRRFMDHDRVEPLILCLLLSDDLYWMISSNVL